MRRRSLWIIVACTLLIPLVAISIFAGYYFSLPISSSDPKIPPRDLVLADRLVLFAKNEFGQVYVYHFGDLERGFGFGDHRVTLKLTSRSSPWYTISSKGERDLTYYGAYTGGISHGNAMVTADEAVIHVSTLEEASEFLAAAEHYTGWVWNDQGLFVRFMPLKGDRDRLYIDIKQLVVAGGPPVGLPPCEDGEVKLLDPEADPEDWFDYSMLRRPKP